MCGECYGITFYRGGNSARHVIRYDAVGHRGGGYCEANFVPHRRSGFREWLKDALRLRGYTPDSVTPELKLAGGRARDDAEMWKW